jgi:signal transduction histidine kinase
MSVRVELPTMPSDVWDLLDLTRATEYETLEGYLSRMLALCQTTFGAEGASLFLGHENDDRFTFIQSIGSLSRIPSEASIVRGVGIAGAAILRGRAMIVTDPSEHPGLEGVDFKPRSEIGSSMVIPLSTPHVQCFGVLNVARRAGERDFDVDDLRRAESIAQQIALAVSNARLYMRANMMVHEIGTLSAKLQSIIDHAGFGLLVISESNLVTEMNPQAQALLGPLSHPPRTWSAYVDNAPDGLREGLTAAIQAGMNGEIEKRRVVDEAAQTVHYLHATPLQTGGCTVAIEDFTEHERHQREFERAKRLAEIGQLTAAIAHEIRNPLTGIRSAAQMVQANPEYAEEFGRVIEEEAIKLNDLCTQFLDFAKPVELRLKEVLPSAIARRVIERHRTDFHSAHVDIVLEVDGDERPVMADEDRLEQIFRNLLLNALQACGSTGRVAVHAANGRISFVDTGRGMAADVLDDIFTPFFTTRAQGTGLGLSNVRKLLDAHQATIHVRSEPGEGSTFEIVFDPRFGR